MIFLHLCQLKHYRNFLRALQRDGIRFLEGYGARLSKRG
jgi:hypothetical protein